MEGVVLRARIFFAAIVLVVCGNLAFGQSTGDYRSNVISTGNWSDASSWQRFNGSSWVAAVSPPTSADGAVTIRNGHRIDLILATTIDQVVVDAGGQLFIFHLVTPFVCTLANGAGTDITNNGTLVVSVNATLSGAGSIVNNAGATFIVRNTGTLAVTATNNGTMQVNGTGTFSGNTVTNNASFTLADFTLNLNNATFTNHGTLNLPSVTDTFIAGTGGGTITNETGGTIYKSSALGSAWIDPAPGNVAFTNRGIVKGIGDFIIRSTVSNTGTVTPGNNGAGSLLVSPAFVTGKTPAFSLEINSTGGIAGINYDRVNFSNVDAATINISGASLDVTDYAGDAIGTVYTLFSSTSTITGTFASVHLPATLGNLTYNANSITVQKISSVARYTWNGGNGSWTTSTNWLPFRTSPATSDVLTFNSGTTVTITGVPTESIGGLNVTNNTTVALQAATSSKTLTVGRNQMEYLNVDPGSTLRSLNNAGVVLNITIASGSRAVIGGVVDMQNGTFGVQDNSLTLHTTAVPLTRTAGQFAVGSGGSISFGDNLHPNGPTITLGNSIFVSSPIINRITLFNSNGAALGNQDITVNDAVFTLGNLTTNASARLKFSTTASAPVEKTDSKIIGYAEMLPRTVGTAALNFLGVNLTAGSDIGTVSITRITGAAGINTFNGFSSIAATWNISASVEPSPARNVTFSWFSDFDNTSNTSLLFQAYRFDSGPNWTPVGPLAALASPGNPRSTQTTGTTKLTGAWTVADQLNVLPVTLTKFSGEQHDDQVKLEWTTGSELNSDYFEIQRMNVLEEGFSVIGSVKAAGTTNIKQHYVFHDTDAQTGTNYYRLKMVDFDGSFDYSNVVAIGFDRDLIMSVFPNPSSGAFTIRLPEKQRGILTIKDLNQRTVYQQMTPGDSFQVEFSVPTLPPGIYIAWYTITGRIISKRFVIR